MVVTETSEKACGLGEKGVVADVLNRAHPLMAVDRPLEKAKACLLLFLSLAGQIRC